MPTDVCIDRNRAPKNDEGDFPAIHGIIYTAISRFGSVELMRFINSIQGCRRPFKPDDVHCSRVVVDYYAANPNTTPAWLSAVFA